jgi:TolA-binding protein
VSSGETVLPVVVRRALRLVHAAPAVEPEIRTMLDRWRAARVRRIYGLLVATMIGVTALTALTWAGVVAWRDRIRVIAVGDSGDFETGWIGAEPTDPLPVRFSDGSAVELAPGTRARVSSVGLRGANLILENGDLHAVVAHRGLADWAIAAGPYNVKVTGTELDVAWDPEMGQLEVVVQSGTVSVTGPSIAGEQIVSAGQELSVTHRNGTIRLGPQEVDPPAADPADVDLTSDPLSTDGVDAVDNVEAPRKQGETRNVSASKAWVLLAKRGDYERALDVVLRAGFDAVVRESSAAELLLLSDAARMAGQPARASEILHAVRRRFPRGEEASLAAYTLGVSAFDHDGAHAEAATWFETYLRERPNGALAAEALGRLVECEASLGQGEKAQAVARRYLAAYPAGAHRDVAVRLMSR